jgi:Glycosyltransferase Family 4
MRVGVDARHLTAGRGVARYTRALLGAIAAAHPEDVWLAFVPGRAPAAAPPGVRLVRHPLPGRALFGAAAVVRRPRLDRLLGEIDVLWAPAPAPLAVSPGVPLVLTVHDRSFELRPGDFTRYERLWHRLARPRALAARADAVVCDAAAVREDLARAWGVRAWRRASSTRRRPPPTPTARGRTCCSSAPSSRARGRTSSPPRTRAPARED